MKQPMPTINNHPKIVDLVKADLDQRLLEGIRKYNTALQPFNGRDALQDAYEEALDLAQYLKQAIMERDAKQIEIVQQGDPALIQTDIADFVKEK